MYIKAVAQKERWRGWIKPGGWHCRGRSYRDETENGAEVRTFRHCQALKRHLIVMCGMHEEINPRNVGLGTQASAQHTGKALRETRRGLTEPGEKGAFRRRGRHQWCGVFENPRTLHLLSAVWRERWETTLTGKEKGFQNEVKRTRGWRGN